MGEIATWSAVKTKVGLGKDSNECPTKAELLALSPTGTGESYIGLEISNASSYGDNETIQLSDIHKVTYKYTLALTNKTLNFTALGGAPTPAGFDLVTQKQKYLDGVAQSGVIPVSYNLSAHPDWIYSENGLKATENLNTQERYGSVTFTQAESGKSIDGAVSQAAASQRFEYTFSSKYPGINFNALGGVSSANKILDITSTRQEYRNNHTYGNLVQISFTNTGLPSWLINTNESWSAQENKSLSSRSHSMTYTQNESGKKFTVTFNQAAGTQTYGDITINPTSGIADIPAAGGTSGVFTYSYSQPWGWNGKTNDGGTITSGAIVNWSNAISGSNLGTTQKARTRLGSRTLRLSQNGKSASKSVDVYQAANQIVNVTQGAWVVSISANPSTFTGQGGTSQISAGAQAPRTNHWSSGATSAASDATGTPTLSIPTAVTGFSLSGTTLTVAENPTPNQRSVVVRATMDTVYKEVTVTQSAYVVEWKYYLTTSTPTLNFDVTGSTQSGTISSYREKYINGSLVEGSNEGVNIQVKSMSAEIQSATAAVAITMKENTTTQARTGTVVYEQVGSGKTVTITCNQAAGTGIREEFHAKFGNYYQYGDSDIIPLIYQWSSPDGSDPNVGDLAPEGYTGVWCKLPATGVINCSITGRPQYGKPIKAQLMDFRVRTIDGDVYPEVETIKGLLVEYDPYDPQDDYHLRVAYSPGMNDYFLVTPEITYANAIAGTKGEGLKAKVELINSYSQIGTTIATITFTPKNPDHPIIYWELIYG